MAKPSKESCKEITVLEQIKKRKLKGFCNMLSHGTTEDGLQYIIMGKLGPSLKSMLRKTKSKRFSIKTSI